MAFALDVKISNHDCLNYYYKHSYSKDCSSFIATIKTINLLLPNYANKLPLKSGPYRACMGLR
jgi:hypothetical protein